MKVIKTIKPNGEGAKRFKRQWGDELIAVRYREDSQKNKVHTTIEIVVDTREKMPCNTTQFAVLAEKAARIVAIRVSYEESEIRERIKQNGARWSQQLKLWLLRYDTVVSMALRERIVEGAAERCQDVDTSFMLGS